MDRRPLLAQNSKYKNKIKIPPPAVVLQSSKYSLVTKGLTENDKTHNVHNNNKKKDVIGTTKHGRMNQRRLSLVPCACSLEGATQKCNLVRFLHSESGHPENIHVNVSNHKLEIAEKCNIQFHNASYSVLWLLG